MAGAVWGFKVYCGKDHTFTTQLACSVYNQKQVSDRQHDDLPEVTRFMVRGRG